MPQDSVEAGEPVGRDPAIPRISRLRRPLVLVLVSLGLVSGGAVVGSTAASAAAGSSETATVQDPSSGSRAEPAQEDGSAGEGQRDCPHEDEGETSA